MPYLSILLMVAFGGYALWMMSKRNAALKNIGPALHRFFESTGYVYPDLLEGSVEEQVRAAEQRMAPMLKGTGGELDYELVRNFHGLTVRHHIFIGASKEQANTTVMSAGWDAEPETAPGVHWQAAAKSLSSLGKVAREAFSNSTRRWAPAFKHKVASGDAELDKALNFYTDTPEALGDVLATPGLKEALLACVELDLVVDDEGAHFADPLQKNMRAGMGGTMGMMAVGLDYGKLFDLTIPVHERIAELLALSLQASV